MVINKLFIEIVKKSFGQGGCLLYLDFGDSVKLEENLDLTKINIKRDFKGFKIIEPINIATLDINTSEPARQDYMEPKKDIAEWLKKDKKLNLGNIEIDDNVINQQELDDYETLLQDKETADDQKQE